MAKIDEVLICKALGDPNRMEIVKMLSKQEKCGCKLLENLAKGSVRNKVMSAINNDELDHIFDTDGEFEE